MEGHFERNTVFLYFEEDMLCFDVDKPLHSVPERDYKNYVVSIKKHKNNAELDILFILDVANDDN